MSLVIFSNSEYSFLWPIIEESISQIFFYKIFVCDENDLNKPNGFDQYIYYRQNNNYTKRWTQDILPKIASDYILVVHDIQVIVNCEANFFLKIVEIMNQESIDRCSMNVFKGTEIIQKNGITLCSLNNAVGNTCTPFDLCPAIWNKNSLNSLFNTFCEETYAGCESSKPLQEFCKTNLKCFGLQSTNAKKYYCLGRPNLNEYKTLYITTKKEIVFPFEAYMDMKEIFFYYANKYKLHDFVKINSNYNFILTGFTPI